MCVGPRRLTVRPIYSQHTRGGGKGVNNVHKFERFLRHGQAYVATVYGPITFGNQPCILLRESDDEGTFSFSRFLALSFRCTDSGAGPKLVASGAFMNADTTRIIAKRIILTGHPFKVHKRTATVRYMFFNPGKYFYACRSKLSCTISQTISLISSQYNFIQSMGAQDTLRSLLEHMAISRHTSTVH
jgi:pre-rRNA-processing protein TSR1